jgi:hypothetical protein
MMGDDSAARLICRHLKARTTSWSLGMIGAVAEFHHGEDPPAHIDEWTAVTSLGAIRVRPRPGMRLRAYELLSTDQECWQHGVAVCLPEDDARMQSTRFIRELGPDRDAVRIGDREGVLFDLGLGSSACLFCVRLFESAQIGALRECVGAALMDQEQALYRRIRDWNPHRVALAASGRIEVYAPIGHHEAPSGPHTHLIPHLLRPSRTVASTVPVPPGYTASLVMYPENPLRDTLGRRKPFSPSEHQAFQEILAAFGDESYLRAKSAASLPAASRLERLAQRVAARQTQASQEGIS